MKDMRPGEALARKLAHEIKNPLTPIQLTIDRIKTKFKNQINNTDKSNFEENLKILIIKLNK